MLEEIEKVQLRSNAVGEGGGTEEEDLPPVMIPDAAA